MIPIIGEISIAEKHKEQYRTLMQKAKTQKEHAEYKREFRKARDRILFLKERIKSGAVVQLEEHRPVTAKVAGASPVGSAV